MTSKIYLSPQVASATPSKVETLVLLIHSSLFIPLFVAAVCLVLAYSAVFSVLTV